MEEGDPVNHRSSSHRWGGGAAVHRLFLQVRCLCTLRHPSTRACPDQGRLQNPCQSQYSGSEFSLTSPSPVPSPDSHCLSFKGCTKCQGNWRFYCILNERWALESMQVAYPLWVLAHSLAEGLGQTLVSQQCTLPYKVGNLLFLSPMKRDNAQTKVSISSTHHTMEIFRREKHEEKHGIITEVPPLCTTLSLVIWWLSWQHPSFRIGAFTCFQIMFLPILCYPSFSERTTCIWGGFWKMIKRREHPVPV